MNAPSKYNLRLSRYPEPMYLSHTGFRSISFYPIVNIACMNVSLPDPTQCTIVDFYDNSWDFIYYYSLPTRYLHSTVTL